MYKRCKQCNGSYVIADDDLLLLGKLSPVIQNESFQIPLPALCPNCRQQRRLGFRNERALYMRKCDLTGEDTLSVYPANSPHTIYSPEAWFSDKWDAKKYGRDFDFSKTLFEQLKSLFDAVPKLAIHVSGNENSDYVNLTGFCKNSYLNIACEYNEDCYYAERTIKCKDCMDTTETFNSELCYFSVDIFDSYQLFYSELCRNCSESVFLYNCIGCNNCLMCSNLRDKSYCILNKQYTREEYMEQYKDFIKNLSTEFDKFRNYFTKIKKEAVKKYCNNLQIENCIGDYIFKSKNCTYSFDIENSEDCRYCYAGYNIKDNLDMTNTTETELCYEGSSVGYHTYRTLFSVGIWPNSYDVMYSNTCKSCNNIFGCTGLKNSQYCILNKQYTKEEYEKLLKKILEYIKETGEFGEHFPLSMSPFAYNETTAQDYFPINKNQALLLGSKWKETNSSDNKTQTYVIPTDIHKVKDDILSEVLTCKTCKKNYKIIAQELAFYRKFQLPIPRKCPDCRYHKRLSLRNSRTLYPRKCSKCRVDLMSTYSKKEEKDVYCDTCYLEEIA